MIGAGVPGHRQEQLTQPLIVRLWSLPFDSLVMEQRVRGQLKVSINGVRLTSLGFTVGDHLHPARRLQPSPTQQVQVHLPQVTDVLSLLIDCSRLLGEAEANRKIFHSAVLCCREDRPDGVDSELNLSKNFNCFREILVLSNKAVLGFAVSKVTTICIDIKNG